MIAELEEKLRQAQFTNDVSALDALIAEELQFVVFDGTTATKAQDLESHRNKIVTFKSITLSDQVIKNFDKTATVTVKAHIKGSVNGSDFEGNYRYLRTWALMNGSWKIISGSVTAIV